MRRVCSSGDPFVGNGMTRCGATFDDLDHSTICPHEYLPTPAERQALLRDLAVRPDIDAETREHINALIEIGNADTGFVE